MIGLYHKTGPDDDEISEGSIRKYLGELYDTFTPEIFQEIGSTNSYLKEKSDGMKPWHAVIASGQSMGRGRRGRTFASPSGTGVYLSVLLKPELLSARMTMITAIAAVAACRAIEACTEEKAYIKWVNDIFVRGKKVCGILTEALVDPDSGAVIGMVMGAGFNVYEPDGGFPEEIKDIAGAITEGRSSELRSRIAAGFLKEFRTICSAPEACDHIKEYRERSFVIGTDINVISGSSVRPAKAMDIDDECRLIVVYDDGTREALSSGEVSVRERIGG